VTRGAVVACGRPGLRRGLAVALAALAAAGGGMLAVQVTIPQSAARARGWWAALCGWDISTPLTAAVMQAPVPITAYHRCRATELSHRSLVAMRPLPRTGSDANLTTAGNPMTAKQGNAVTPGLHDEAAFHVQARR
jgi:hypothetical protein